MALRSPKSPRRNRAQAESHGDPPRSSGRGWAIARSALVVLILTAAGALIAVGVVEGKGVQYRATIPVRSATSDASCIYFTCSQPVSTTQGNPYVLDQVNSILSPALASQVQKRVPTLTTAKLLANVCAKEVGQSATIDICYQAPSAQTAKTVVAAYGTQYVAWSNARAVAQLSALHASMLGLWNSFQATGQQSGNRGQTLAEQMDVVKQAIKGFQANNGPNGAKIFGSDPLNQVKVVRSTASPTKAGAIGAAAGLVLAIGLLLILPPLIRRPGSGDDDDRPGGDAASGEESLDLFTAPVDEPVR